MREWVNKISIPYNEKNTKQYKQFIQELSQEAMPQSNIPAIAENIEFEEEKEQEKEIIIPKKKTTKKSNKFI